MKTLNLIRLSLFQMGFGIMLGFLHDTLNRVMTTDLGISSTIVFGLISLKELLAIFGVKVWAGNMSDRSHIFGLRRTPYILLGLLSCVFSFIFAPAAAYEVSVAGKSFSDLLVAVITDIGLLKLAVIFLVFGFGLQVATTAYYALLADTVGEEHIGKVTGASWTLMVLTTIVSTRIVGSFLDVYTPERLITVAEVGGFVALCIGLFAVLGVEKRNVQSKEGKSKHSISFSQSIRLLSSSPRTLQFAFYIFISIFALFANEIVMDPFGGDVFGMPVGTTTKLFRPTMGGTQLIFMLIVGFLLNRIGQKRGAHIGNFFGIIGFSMLIAAGFMRDEQFLRIALVVTGIGLGAASVSNISMMMTMTAGRSGIYIGLWGTAQSLAIFLGHFGAGIIRDVVYHFSGTYVWAYAAIFMMEIIAFSISSLVLPHISKEAFEAESELKIAELQTAGEA
ncbi:MAG: BCD family MFS transporter [Chlorobium limicola]|jgi:MFS transporter, BCD family, chlorophyll transporter|uniref:PUCC protein n=1 Tax=Chlorobium limicola (strain DSM 245 / NBRC 103803 / 6330) TaxID=290315 RepID=B3EE08_CHLL2|nr:BCD family MFS transporter [Chlorobium limicola]ACD90710.1 PUCC protein [Chlorobium limicola DSM 245]NTV20645.1 BCD family MFS transporter [Chlorobium limicola]